MRQLLPYPAEDVDTLAVYHSDERPPAGDRPWVAVVMISSADGAATLEGRSGGLGSPADRLVMRAYRGLADVVLVGAATVRAERYRVPRPADLPEGVDGGGPDGEPRRPRLVVVSASCDLDPALPLFEDPQHQPIVATTSAADPSRRERLAEVAEVLLIGDGPSVDLAALLAELADRGVRTVVSEGGPVLLAQLIEDDLLDELSLTLAPWLLSGDAQRIAHSRSGAPEPVGLVIHRLLEEDDLLFITYRRAGRSDQD